MHYFYLFVYFCSVVYQCSLLLYAVGWAVHHFFYYSNFHSAYSYQSHHLEYHQTKFLYIIHKSNYFFMFISFFFVLSKLLEIWYNTKTSKSFLLGSFLLISANHSAFTFPLTSDFFWLYLIQLMLERLANAPLLLVLEEWMRGQAVPPTNEIPLCNMDLRYFFVFELLGNLSKKVTVLYQLNPLPANRLRKHKKFLLL